MLLRDREKFLHIIDGDKRLIASDTNKKEALPGAPEGDGCVVMMGCEMQRRR